MDRTSRKDPLVVIVGATGTGKSKLAVELASRFNGEIINADAVQMYRGLPIVTNKMPVDERNGVPHHLLDQIGLDEQPWTVLEFLRESSRIIQQIRERGKVPIVVGGTNYYIYSLLFKDATVGENKKQSGDQNGEVHSNKQVDLAILDQSNETIYAKLLEVDPEIARRWHPNDRRKVQRSLEICLTTGRKASEIYAAQKATNNGDDAGALDSLRHDPLIFWLDAEDSVLKQRLNDRVGVMVQQGLLEEVMTMRSFENDFIAKRQPLDKTKGIWVAIGYKELAPWLDAREALDREEVTIESVNLAQLQHDGIESVKAGTRQYAKRQNNWVRIKVAQSLQRAARLDRLLLLDCTDLQAWDENVAQPSVHALAAFLAGDRDDPTIRRLTARACKLVQRELDRPGQETHFCETCQRTTMTSEEWAKHLRSRGHKRALERVRKRADRDAYFAKLVAEKQQICTPSAQPVVDEDVPDLADNVKGQI